MGIVDFEKKLGREEIVFLLEELDYGLKQSTSDIDILEISPESESMSFKNSVLSVLTKNHFPIEAINSSAGIFAKYLSPNFRERLTPFDVGLKNICVFFISKPDLVTMKICASRDKDFGDYEN